MRPGFDFAGKRVLVVGLARTGIATALFAAGYGATVTATDEKSESELGDAAERLRATGVKLELGRHTNATFLDQDLIVLSPGVPVKLAPVAQARSRGVTVWSEIELCGDSCGASSWRSPARTEKRQRLRWWRTF